MVVWNWTDSWQKGAEVWQILDLRRLQTCDFDRNFTDKNQLLKAEWLETNFIVSKLPSHTKSSIRMFLFNWIEHMQVRGQLI